VSKTDIMKREEGLNWSERYLDTLEEIYGPFNLHPALSVVDLCKEWSENFSREGKIQVASRDMAGAQEWSAGYMTALESLYGEINAPRRLTVEEMCEEWKACFYADESTQAEMARRQEPEVWTETYLQTWPLRSAS
jgi:hypothetical protein